MCAIQQMPGYVRVRNTLSDSCIDIKNNTFNNVSIKQLIEKTYCIFSIGTL